jgi:GNAT superfamily N-acetyltransferase
MPNWTLDITTNPAKADIDAVERGLGEYNEAQLGREMATHFVRLAIFARDEQGKIVGGIHGPAYWQWLHVDAFWVDEAYRHQGVGSRLIETIEAEARAQDMRGVHLETTDFQALPFYQRHGYTVFGELQDKPEGHTWYFLQKRLV